MHLSTKLFILYEESLQKLSWRVGQAFQTGPTLSSGRVEVRIAPPRGWTWSEDKKKLLSYDSASAPPWGRSEKTSFD
jgi:hypothetical protein